MKNFLKSLMGLSVILGGLYVFTKINIDFWWKKIEPSNYWMYIGIVLTIIIFNGVNNNSDNNGNDNNVTNFN